MPVVDAVSLIEPPECAEGFIADFLHHACDGETSLRPGDVVSLESGIAVKGGHIVDIVCMQGRVDVVGAPAEDSSHCGETASWLRVRARVATASTGFAPPGYLLVNGVTSCSDDIDATEEGWLPVSAVVDSTVSNPKGYVTKMFNVYFEDDHPFGADACRGKVQIGEYDIAEFVIECPSLAKIWDRHQSVVDKVEGVVIRDDLLDSTLVENLMVGVDRLIESQGEPDFHPNTNGVVLDIVHPSLYPYVRGITKVINEPIDSRGDPPAVSDRENAGSSADGSESDVSSPRKDRWGRRYEDSKFQWLPSVFEISGSGTCAVKSYINNLPMENNVELVAALERLFEAFVPLFEACYSYIRAIRFHDSDEDDDIMDICRTYEPDIAGASLRNRELKVVTKIVEYQLGEGDSFDGVWHVEGMSHESIVMTGLFILDRDEGFDGGELLFKVRPPTLGMAGPSQNLKKEVKLRISGTLC